jgi:hypothetical protein
MMQKQANSVDILCDLALDRLDAQLKRIDGMDTKIGVTFGLTNGIIAALAAFITLIPHPLSEVTFIFGILAAVAYVVTLVFLFFAYRWGRWSFRPDLSTLRKICTDPQYHDYPDIVKEWIANECIRSLETNKQPTINKAWYAYLALVSLSAQGVFLAASILGYFFN